MNVSTSDETQIIHPTSDSDTTQVYTENNTTIIDTAMDEISIGPGEPISKLRVTEDGHYIGLLNFLTPATYLSTQYNAVWTNPVKEVCQGTLAFETHYANWSEDGGFQDHATYVTLEWRSPATIHTASDDEDWNDTTESSPGATFIPGRYVWDTLEDNIQGDYIFAWLNRTVAQDLETAQTYHDDQGTTAEGVFDQGQIPMELEVDVGCQA